MLDLQVLILRAAGVADLEMLTLSVKCGASAFGSPICHPF